MGCDILVVDDVPANIVAIEAALEPLAQRIVTATSGNEALRKLLDGDFAVVLHDVQMPEMDGYETARWIRSRDRTRHLPIIFVTAHSHDDEAVLRAYRLGVVDFLFKPLNPDVLRAKTSVFVELAKAQARDQECALREERTKLENGALRVANEQLALADRRKNEFLAMLSHELRNPLMPIASSLEILEQVDPNSERGLRAWRVLRRQVHHLSRIVDELLDITRMAHGRIELYLQSLDLSVLLSRTIEDQHAAFVERGGALTLALPDEAVLVRVDATRVMQALGNLLHNALKFTCKHGTVDVALTTIGETAVVRVRDDGVGIAADVLEHLFEPFVQVESTLARTLGGLGLGLSLVKGLVELHGGTVTATSEGADKGATFEIRLRLDEARRESLSAQRDMQRSEPRRVVLIEDSPDIAQLLRNLLELEGHQVFAASAGRDGLRLVSDIRPDVVFCDIGLPDIDGYAVAQTIRADPALANTFLIALSGYARPEDIGRSRDAGFDRHLAKPATRAALVATLAEGRGASPVEEDTGARNLSVVRTS